MSRLLPAMLLLAGGWSFGGVDLDRLRWNVRERTEAGLDALEEARTDEAVAAFETAAGIDPEAPRPRFNAGTARLLAAGSAGSPGFTNPGAGGAGSDSAAAAIAHLEAAAAAAGPPDRPDTLYNLGNAHFQAGDLAGAIDAFEETLRVAPGHLAAKHNLEIALQQQQQQQEQQQEDGPENDSDDDDDSEQSPSPEGEDSNEETGPDGRSDDPGEQHPPEPEAGPSDLPDFEEQEDMSREQAEAILEAVENMEREQRRRLAAEGQKDAAAKGKDW